MDKTPVHQSLPQGSQHHVWAQCGLCTQQLPLNYMYFLGPEVHELNQVLANLSVPVSLLEMLGVCKLCYYFCQLCLSYKHHQPLSYSNRLFCEKYRKKILHQNNIEESGKSGFLPRSKRRITKPSSAMSESLKLTKEAKKDFKSLQKPYGNVTSFMQHLIMLEKYWRSGDLMLSPNASESAKTYISCIDNRIKSLEGPTHTRANLPVPTTSATQESGQSGFLPRSKRRITKPSSAVSESLKLTKEAKKDFRSLQKPYGNVSSFMQHLIMLEKYWRSGDLMLSPNASESAKTYISCIDNRIKSLEGPTHTRANLPVPTTSATHFSPALPIVAPCQSVPPLPPLLVVVPSQIPLQMPPPPVTNSANN